MFSGQIEFSSAAEPTPCQRFSAQIDKDTQLRQLALEDAAELFALTEANRNRLREWLPWLDDNTIEEHSRQYIQSAQASAEANQGFVAAICCGGAIAGLVGIHGTNWAARSTSIGYWLGQSYEGKGLMTRACKAVVNYAFTALKLHRVDILCAPQNTRSCAVPKRLGFTYEGTLRESEYLYGRFVDHRVYAILSHEWPAASAL